MAKTTDKNGNPIDFEIFRKQAYDEILKGKSLNRSRRCPNSPDQGDRPDAPNDLDRETSYLGIADEKEKPRNKSKN